MNRLGACLNWKVCVGLTIVAVGLALAAAPGASEAALPVLLAAACPLSMLLTTRFTPHGRRGLNPPPELVPAPVPVRAVTVRR